MDVWLAVGLGNPGKTYERTRHNAGARAAERLAERLGVKLRPSKAPALVGEGSIEGERVVVARPTTFMNESGRAVRALMESLKLDPSRLIVLHDDIDLQAGKLRLKRGGGDAGHHGLESIVSSLGTGDFFRVRIGVGRPEGPQDPADWVLEPMSQTAAKELSLAEAEAAEGALAIIREGLERAKSRFNPERSESTL
jgi:PTH1 family peptidyl-tRNA hydrolase